MIPAPHTIAREAYRLWRDRGIAPDETFRAWLEAEGYVPEYRGDNAAYRRAYPALAAAWAQVAWPLMGRDARLCVTCGRVMQKPGIYCQRQCRDRHQAERATLRAA